MSRTMLTSSNINEFAVLAVFDGKTVTVFPKTEEKSKWNVQWITSPQTKFWYLDKDHYYEYREGLLVGIAHNEEFYWKIASESIKWLASAFSQFPDPRVEYLDVIQHFDEKESIDQIINDNDEVLWSKVKEKMVQRDEIFKERIESSDALLKKYYPVLVRPINLDPNWSKTRMKLDIRFLTSSLKDQTNLKEFSMEDGGPKLNPMDLLPAFVVVVLFNDKSLTASICEKSELSLKKINWIKDTKFWFLDKDLIYTEGIVVAKNDNKCMLDVRIGLEQSKWILPENNFDTFPDENVHQKEYNKVFYRRRAATYELAFTREEDFHHWRKLFECEGRYENFFTERRNLVSSNLNKNCEVNTQDENLGVAQLLTRFATIVQTFDGNILNVQSCKGSDWDRKEIQSITNTKFWYRDKLYYHEGIVIATCCNEDVLDVRKAFRKSEWIRPDDDFFQFPDPASSMFMCRYGVFFANKRDRDFFKNSATMQASDNNTEHRKENNRSELSKEAPIEHREIKRPTTVEASGVSSKLMEKVQVETARAKEDLEPTTTSASNFNNCAITEKDMNFELFEDTDSERKFMTIVFLFNGKFFSVHSYAETELYSEEIHWITDTKFWFLDRQKNSYSEGIVVNKCNKEQVPVKITALEESAMSIVEGDFHPFPDLNQKAVNVVEEFNRRRISIQNEMSEESPKKAQIIRNLLLNYKEWVLIWGKRHGLDKNCPEPLDTPANPTEQLEVSKKNKKKLNELNERPEVSSECNQQSHENDQNKRVTRASIRAQNRRSSPPKALKAAHVDLPKVSKHLLRENPSRIGRRDLKSHKLKYSKRNKIQKKQDKIASKKLTKRQFLQILGLMKKKRK